MQVLFSAAVIVLVPVQLFLEHKTMFYLHSSTIYLFIFIFIFPPPHRPHIDPTSTLHRPLSIYLSSSSFLLFSLLLLLLLLLLLIFIVFPPLPPPIFVSSVCFRIHFVTWCKIP